MAEDPKKKSIDSMLQDSAIEKFGLKPVMDKIEKIMPLLEQVAAGAEVIKGQDGKTPKLGEDYLTEEEQLAALDMVRPQKGVDYNDGEPGKDGYTPQRGLDYLTDEEMAQIKKEAMPVKGKDYYTPQEIAEFKASVTPKKGSDYNDGENPTPSQFIEAIKGLKGKDAADFSVAVGSKIDISNIRNAQSFIFNGKRYKTEELMHGGGSGSSGGGTVTTISVATANGFSGTVATATTTPVITLATSVTGILIGNGTSISNVTIGTGLSLVGSTLSATGIASTPGGPTTAVQYNTSGAFTGASNFTFDGSNLQIQSVETTLYADMFAGVDLGAKINAAYSALASTGGVIRIPAGIFSFLTPIVFGTANKFVSLVGTGAASTYLKYTPTSGTAITINCGNPTGHLVYEMEGFTLMGSSTLIAAGNTNTNTSVGIFYGGSNGAVGVNTHDHSVNGFGTNWEIGSNAYMLAWNNCSNSGGNGGQASRGALLHIDAASNSGERNVFNQINFTDPGNSLATNAIYITNTGTASNFFSDCSIDDAQVFIGTNNGQVSLCYNHFENAAFGTYAQYIPVLGVSSDLATQITFIGNEIANDGTNSGNTFQTIIKHGGQLFAAGNHINNYGGATITNFVDHSLDNGLESEIVGMTQVQGGGLTNLIAGGGGVTYDQATAAGWVQDVGNSFSIGMRAKSNNTNEFFSGNSIVATFDHGGNWVFGAVVGSSTTTLKGNLLMNGSSSGTTTIAATAVASGTLTLPAATDQLVARATTDTLTNKRITRRNATTNAPGATPTTNSDNVDLQIFTGLATAITSMTTNLSGTPTTGQFLEFWLTDNGTARAITWGASFAATTVALPTTTVISTKLRVLFEWGGSTFDCVAVA